RVRRLDLRRIWVDEERDADARFAQRRDEGLQPGGIGDDVESTFGRDLLTALRHEAARMRRMLDGNYEHLVGDGHFKIERHRQSQQSLDIAVGNVTPVLAEMRVML